MADYRKIPWRWVALAVFGLAACGGGSESGSGLPGQPFGTSTFTLQRVFSSLPLFTSPVAMLQAPGDSTRWFVVEQAGQVRVFDNNAAVTVAPVFVDIDDGNRVTSGGETGLLGMAFHPGFPADPRVYLFYSHTDATLGLVSRLSEFSMSAIGFTLDPNSERVLLTIRKPPTESNHNGGNIAFGPDDGFLYIGVGDGGGSNDGGSGTQHGPIGNGQSPTTLLGKMLRIDVAGTPYAIPSDNPFAGNTLCGTNGTGTQSCPEIFAIGFRNPWRWSFDRDTGNLWVADVGQGQREEVDRVTLDGNYGWRCLEGTRNTGLPCGSLPNRLPPVVEYNHTVGRSITGGYVYRGSMVTSLVGRYIFGDFETGRIFNIAENTQPTLTLTGGFASGLRISSFGEGNDGELYVVHYGGELYRISP